MKKYSILALTLVLTAAVLTGCGRRRVPETVPPTETMMPTIMPTEAPTTVPHTEATTEAATHPSTGAAGHQDPTADVTEHMTTGTEPTDTARSRTHMPNVG